MKEVAAEAKDTIMGPLASAGKAVRPYAKSGLSPDLTLFE